MSMLPGNLPGMGQQGGGLAGLLQNPMFMASLGLLQSSYDKKINPYGAAMQGLLGAQQQRQYGKNQKRRDVRMQREDTQYNQQQQAYKQQQEQQAARAKTLQLMQGATQPKGGMGPTAPPEHIMNLLATSGDPGMQNQGFNGLLQMQKQDAAAAQQNNLFTKQNEARITADAMGHQNTLERLGVQQENSFSNWQAQQEQKEAARIAEEQRKVQIKDTERLRVQKVAADEFTAENEKFASMIGSDDFPGAVGMIDQYTGAIGAQFGSDQGVLGKRAQRAASKLVLSAADHLKGAMSDRDIQLLMDSAPGVGDGVDVWKDWYSHEFLPQVNAARGNVGMVALNDPFTPKDEPEYRVVQK